MVSNWETAHSLVEDAVSGAEIAADSCLPALAVACWLWLLPACLQQGDGPVRSRPALLWYKLSPLFCEQARLCIRIFCRKVLFFFVCLFLAIPQFGLLSHVRALRLSSKHSGPVLTLSMQPTPPCSAPAHCWQTQASVLLFH